jgi:hypothetical protein
LNFFVFNNSLCDSIETQDDVDNFFQTVAGNFEGVVQYNKDNRAFEVILFIFSNHFICLLKLGCSCN